MSASSLNKQFKATTHFITTALPYANGDLHFGHFFEAVIADIYAKKTQTCLVSGDDQHGAAITIFAQKNKLNILEHIKKQHQAHQKQYQKLGVHFDYFGQTHSKLHQELVLFFYKKLVEKKVIITKTIQCWFDESSQQFLPDRYVRGTCPNCKKENIYPNICEFCGKSFDALNLIEPVSIISQTTPSIKETVHAFIDSEKFYENLRKILEKKIVCESVKSKVLDSQLKNNLDIDITRDSPYFGIKVPELDQIKLLDQFFYVWFDAPIAYISFALEKINLEHHAQFNDHLTFEELLKYIHKIKLHHVIGKDISYFHTYFWLNLLDLLELDNVIKINTHGWIVLNNGAKLSKSNGDGINLSDYSDEQIDAIRLFFFSIYEDGIQDAIFDLDKIYDQYNTFIVGKVFNLYSRISKIIETKLEGKLIIQEIDSPNKCKVEEAFNHFDFKLAYQNLVLWINDVNAYVQENQPWKENDFHKLNEICNFVLNDFKQIISYLEIICPHLKQITSKINYQDIKHKHLGGKIHVNASK